MDVWGGIDPEYKPRRGLACGCVLFFYDVYKR